MAKKQQNNLSEEEIANLYTLARNARASDEIDLARDSYDKISAVKVNDWEAFFFSYGYSYYGNWVTYVDESTMETIREQIETLRDVASTAVEMLAADPNADKEAAYREIHLTLDHIYNEFYPELPQYTRKLMSEYDAKPDTLNVAIENYSGLKLALAEVGLLATLFAQVCYFFADAAAQNGLLMSAPGISVYVTEWWKRAVSIECFSITMLGKKADKEDYSKQERYTAMIRQYDPNYQPPQLPVQALKPPKIDAKGCYIATCVYGSYDCPQVWTLRRFRDERLAQSVCGRAFIRTYYAVSPKLVRWFGSSRVFRSMWKPMLDHMVGSLKAKGFQDTPYQD